MVITLLGVIGEAAALYLRYNNFLVHTILVSCDLVV